MAFTSKSERVLDFGIPKHAMTPASYFLMRELQNLPDTNKYGKGTLGAIEIKRKL